MIDIDGKTRAIEEILKNALDGDVLIQRNVSRNENPEYAEKGWIGIYKKKTLFETVRTGPNPYQVRLQIDVEAQWSSIDQDYLEKNLSNLEDAILDALISDRSNRFLPLGGINQVEQLVDFEVNYELYSFEETVDVYFQSSILTLTYEVQA